MAHPFACRPEGHVRGDSLSAKDFEGRSEILLEVVRPDGNTVVLRDGPLFKPDRVDRFELKPGDSARIHVGWFFEHASLVWENGVDSFDLFNTPGTYRVRWTYRNQWPVGAVYDPNAPGSTAYLTVWTGELSDAVEVVITADRR